MKHGCVILAVEYHQFLSAIEGLLEVMFETVVMVSSYESLLESAQKICPELIVADLSLPSSDGSRFFTKLDERLGKFRLIVMGPYTEADIVQDIMKSGVNGYVVTQSVATELLTAAEKVLEGETYISSTVKK